jgi:hypothetical protein
MIRRGMRRTSAPSDHLPAQARAEHGRALRHRLAQQLCLGAQVAVLVDVAGRLTAAQRQDAVDLAELGHGIAARQVALVELDAGGPQGAPGEAGERLIQVVQAGDAGQAR